MVYSALRRLRGSEDEGVRQKASGCLVCLLGGVGCLQRKLWGPVCVQKVCEGGVLLM